MRAHRSAAQWQAGACKAACAPPTSAYAAMPRRRLHGVPRKPRNGLCLLVVVVHAAANRRSQRPGKVAARTKTSACTPSAILRRQPIIPQPIMWMRRNPACDPGTNTETTAALARCNACASCNVSAGSQYGVCTRLAPWCQATCCLAQPLMRMPIVSAVRTASAQPPSSGTEACP